MDYIKPRDSRKIRDLLGRTFGRLTVIKMLGRREGLSNVLWLCRCTCGNTHEVNGSALNSGTTRSCGCLASETARNLNSTHGLSHTSEHKAWSSMKERCLNPEHKQYERYGGRLITISERWLESFENFLENMGPRPTPKHSLDRKDNDKGYGPDNCRWATKAEQANNWSNNIKVVFKGREYATLMELSKALGIKYKVLHYQHIRRDLPIDEAVERARFLQAKCNTG